MLARRTSTLAALARPAAQAAAAGAQSRGLATLRSGFGSRPADKSRWGQSDATFNSVLDRFAKVHTQPVCGAVRRSGMDAEALCG